MNCSRYRQLISRYVDDEVTPRQRADLLAHVQVCPDCAAWLARTRHTDVLLKGVRETQPSDRVRNAIINEVRSHNSKQQAQMPQPLLLQPAHRLGSLRMASAGILLRFDLSPARIAVGFAACLVACVGLAFYLNVLPPIWFDKLGFEYQADSNQAVVDVTPIPIHAVSAGQGGVGGPVAVPNLVRILPADRTEDVALDTPLRVRFDQPMDRASVESALRIDPPAAGTFSWDADNEVRFTPAAPGLLRGITYTVTLTGTALSMAGTPIKEMLDWSFRTEAAHAVTALLPDSATIAPTDALGLHFDTAMQRVDAASIVSLRQAGSTVDIPFTHSWDANGELLSLQPATALAEGYYYLRVRADARTATGDTVGRPFEFKYRVQAPVRSLRLPGDRILLASQGSSIPVRYELENSAQSLSDSPTLDVYALPAERLSELGAQANGDGDSDSVLPAGYPAVLQLLTQVQPTSSERAGSIEVSTLPAGIYLLVAHTQTSLDWKMVVVSDHNLTLTGSDSPLWATDTAGRAWAGAEISLYSSKGALIEKGLTDNFGLWQPSAQANGATLALARDLSGHVAASLVDVDTHWGSQPESVLPASLVTDLPSYRPGGTISFRLLLHSLLGDVPTTPVAERDLSVVLLMPDGAPVASLTLKPDAAGAVSGLFPLSSDARPGVYTISVRSGNANHDFPLTVLPAQTDSLSVYVVPSTDTEVGTTITRTVSVLGTWGEPAAGALVTARLGILGDRWVSDPISSTTGSDGRATFVSPLPEWFSRFNDPGIYLNVEAQQGTLHGSSRSYLDLTAQRATMSGMTQLVSPGLNVAVVARPMPDGSFRVRVVLVGQEGLEEKGDILVEAQSLSGEKVSYSLDMARLLDAIVNISQRFAGGTITVRAAGKPGIRTLPLMPSQDVEANLRVIVPYSVTAGSALPVRLGLTNQEGVGIEGTASVWLRRVSGDTSPEAQEWQPNLALTANGTLTTTVQAPNSPGLWYVMSQAATPAGNSSISWSVVRVTPGPWLQVPPLGAATAGVPFAISVLTYNPTTDPLSTGLRASTEGSMQVLDADSQPVDVAAGGWERLQWRALASKAGEGNIAFSFMPSSGASGSWPLEMRAQANPSTNTTYTAGVLTGERNVGVAVPWGLSDDSVRLEIRASNSLLPALAGVATDLQSSTAAVTDGVAMAAARLSAPASVASAYARLGSSLPNDLALSGVERSLLLQQLYSAQHEDGGWSYTLDSAGVSSVRKTAEVLLAFHRQSTYPGGVAPDQAVVNRALDYLSNEVDRPVGLNPITDRLDEHAFGLYVLSLYGRESAEPVRSMLAYASSDTQGHGLSLDGQAWLALALWQVGNGADAVALLDHLLLSEQGASQPASAPLLDALVVGLQSLPAGGARPANLPDYSASARLIVRALMEAREGPCWYTPAMTADAVWALSRYAAAEGDGIQAGVDTPTLMLGDRPVQSSGLPGNSGTLSVLLSGAELRPGTNRLKLKASSPDQVVYYSLTLIATR